MAIAEFVTYTMICDQCSSAIAVNELRGELYRDAREQGTRSNNESDVCAACVDRGAVQE